MSAYHEGNELVKQITANRAARRTSPTLKLLEESIDQAPEEIEREEKRGTDRFGRAFDRGDDAAVITIQQVALQLHSGMLGKLRIAVSNEDMTDFTALLDIADSARDNTVAALIGLRQRLLRATSNMGTSGSASRMMSPSPSMDSRRSNDEVEPKSRVPEPYRRASEPQQRLSESHARLAQPLPP